VTKQFQIPEGAPEGEYLNTITSDELTSDSSKPSLSIEIPLELARKFADDNGKVDVASFFLYSVENLFPTSLPGDEYSAVE
jgi:hypothetical protein